METVRATRTVLRLLLLLAALAIAGAAGVSWAAAGPGTAATPARGTANVLVSDHGPRPPAFFSAARAPGLPVVGRVLETGPPTGGLGQVSRALVHPPFPSSPAPARIRALERSRLGFAHEGVTARSGARSSFSTGLPPPLLA